MKTDREIIEIFISFLNNTKIVYNDQYESFVFKTNVLGYTPSGLCGIGLYLYKNNFITNDENKRFLDLINKFRKPEFGLVYWFTVKHPELIKTDRIDFLQEISTKL